MPQYVCLIISERKRASMCAMVDSTAFFFFFFKEEEGKTNRIKSHKWTTLKKQQHFIE